jgi:hypothetical protein
MHYVYILPEVGRTFSLEEILKFDPILTSWIFVDKRIMRENRRIIYDNWDLVWEKNHHAFWLAVEDVTIMFYIIEEQIKIMFDIDRAAVAMKQNLASRKYLEDPMDPDTVREDLKQAREINSIRMTVRNCISCLRKVRMLKVVIRKSVDAPGSVFDTQKFLKKFTGQKFKEYFDIVKWNVNAKRKSLQYSNEDCAAMKCRAKIIGAHPYNRCEVYDRCNRILNSINKKEGRKYDRLAGAILGKNLKANYWAKIKRNQVTRSLANWKFMFERK